MVSVRRGWGTQRANPRAPAAQRICPSTLRATCNQWAPTGAPDAFREATSAHRGSGTQGTNPGAPAAQRRCWSAPRGSRAQWATAGARAEQGTWGSRTRKHREAGCGRPEDGAVWTAQTVNRPPQPPPHPQNAKYWAPLTRKRHILPHPAQPRHTNYWAPLTRKRHQQEHRPQRPTERSDPTQHAKGRTGDCPGPRKETTTRRNVVKQGVPPPRSNASLPSPSCRPCHSPPNPSAQILTTWNFDAPLWPDPSRACPLSCSAQMCLALYPPPSALFSALCCGMILASAKQWLCPSPIGCGLCHCRKVQRAVVLRAAQPHLLASNLPKFDLQFLTV